MPDRRFRIAALALFTASLSGCGLVPNGSAWLTPSAASTSASATNATPPSANSAAAPPSRPSTPASSGGATGGGTAAASPSTSGGIGAGQGAGPLYDVVGVSDGDTIRVRINGVKETIRIIGLDTPETKKPRVPVQCFGKEASSNMQSLVQSKQVQLEADSSQGERDRYGRLLRHVFVAGTTNVALAQIEGGFGREYTYDGPYAYRLEYLAAMNRAKAAKRGTWGPPCNAFHRADGAMIAP